MRQLPSGRRITEASMTVSDASFKVDSYFHLSRSLLVRWTMTSTDIRSHNTFANPRALEPTDGEVKAGGPTFIYQFAPASVTRLRMALV